MATVSFHLKNGETPKLVVDFLLGKDTLVNTLKSLWTSLEKYNKNNDKPWKSSRILRVKHRGNIKRFRIFHFFHFFHVFDFSQTGSGERVWSIFASF